MTKQNRIINFDLIKIILIIHINYHFHLLYTNSFSISCFISNIPVPIVIG